MHLAPRGSIKACMRSSVSATEHAHQRGPLHGPSRAATPTHCGLAPASPARGALAPQAPPSLHPPAASADIKDTYVDSRAGAAEGGGWRGGRACLRAHGDRGMTQLLPLWMLF